MLTRTTAILSMLTMQAVSIQAQTITEKQRIEDSVIGWFNAPLEKAVKPVTYNGKTFSIRQQDINNLFVQWMQKSYIPVGSLGRVRKYQYSSKKESTPLSYGVLFQTYNVGWKYLDANKHFRPIDEEWTPSNINVNNLSNTWPIAFLNTPDQFYFTMQPNGYMETSQSRKKMAKADPQIHPNVHKYITNISSYWMSVYLSPGNKLPIIPLTKGEYLILVANSFDRWLDNKMKELKDKYGKDQKSIDYFYQYEEARITKYRAVVKKLQQTHVADANEPAVLRHWQPDIYDYDGGIDPFTIDEFEKTLKHYYQVYKYDPAVYAKARTDQPQWIEISFPYATAEDGRGEYERFRAITEHLNFDYIYNYFFDPEKVKGQAYTVNNEALQKATLANYSKRSYWNTDAATGTPSGAGTADKTGTTTGAETATKTGTSSGAATKPLPAGVHFFDDFSTNEVNARPAGWFFRSAGKATAVATVNGMPGKWMKLGYNNAVNSTALKPLPDNFRLEYDVVTDDFSGRWGGSVRMTLDGVLPNSGTKPTTSFLSVEVVSGNDEAYRAGHDFRGVTRIKTATYQPGNTTFVDGPGTSELVLNEFRNKQNKVHVTVVKKGNNFTILINGKVIQKSTDLKAIHDRPCNCNIPAGMQYNKLSFESTTLEADNVGVYISNVQITKE